MVELKANWGGIIRTVQETENNLSPDSQLYKLMQRLQKIEECKTLEKTLEEINTFDVDTRNYLCSPLLDHLYESLYKNIDCLVKNANNEFCAILNHAIVVNDIDMCKFLLDRDIVVDFYHLINAIQHKNGNNTEMNRILREKYLKQQDIFEFELDEIRKEIECYDRVDLLQLYFFVNNSLAKSIVINEKYLSNLGAQNAINIFRFLVESNLVAESVNYAKVLDNLIYKMNYMKCLSVVKYLIEEKGIVIHEVRSDEIRPQDIFQYFYEKNMISKEKAIEYADSMDTDMIKLLLKQGLTTEEKKQILNNCVNGNSTVNNILVLLESGITATKKQMKKIVCEFHTPFLEKEAEKDFAAYVKSIQDKGAAFTDISMLNVIKQSHVPLIVDEAENDFLGYVRNLQKMVDEKN